MLLLRHMDGRPFLPPSTRFGLAPPLPAAASVPDDDDEDDDDEDDDDEDDDDEDDDEDGVTTAAAGRVAVQVASTAGCSRALSPAAVAAEANAEAELEKAKQAVSAPEGDAQGWAVKDTEVVT